LHWYSQHFVGIGVWPGAPIGARGDLVTWVTDHRHWQHTRQRSGDDEDDRQRRVRRPGRCRQVLAAAVLEDNCGLASVADVVGEVTGHAPTESQIIKVAQNTPSSIRNGPIYLPTGDPGHEGDNGGIDMADAVVLLDHYGIKSRMTYDKHPEEVGLPKLEEYLRANRKVIAWVNSGTMLGSSDQRTAPDHFLVVTGIDTNNEIVHLNDPYADHADTKVSIAKFMTAWKIGQESIVVTAQ
jgi:hypothetical protein